MPIVTAVALPLIALIMCLIILAILVDLKKFRKIPFKFSLRVAKYNRSIFNASDIVFKLAQWSLFVAVVTVAAENTESVVLSVMGLVLRLLLIASIYNVIWSLIEARILFSEGTSTLSARQWKILLFLLISYPILDLQNLVGQAVVDFIKNIAFTR